MLILALDTSTNMLNTSVSRGTELICEKNIHLKSSHSKHLLTAIDNILDNAGINLSDIELFASTRGPGSFTGLRIGLSSLKGLSYSLGIPLVTVSTLFVLAKQTNFSTNYICPIIDARKNEVYYSLYSKDDLNKGKSNPEFVGPVSEILKKVDSKTTFTGNGINVYRDFLKDHLINEQIQLKPSVLSNIAYETFISDKKDEAFNSVPEYIRKSDAELNYKK